MTADPTRATLIDGKAFAAGLVDRVCRRFVPAEGGAWRGPGLAVVIVGEDPASQIYVRNKGERPCAPGCGPTPIACPRRPRRPSCWP
jgi:methylenetetrahydrofolate dehydrogenase (NADP+)/methenyltetrahydrofolate cyclohydrolase